MAILQAHEAHERGDGATAHQLSEEGKTHATRMDAYNKQASDFIFRENNAPGRVADDTIDLHGQFVEEAEDILEQRIRYAQQHGQTRLHVYVTPPYLFSIPRLSISRQDRHYDILQL
jgi:DNA-nicking Smr family endonuclease